MRRLARLLLVLIPLLAGCAGGFRTVLVPEGADATKDIRACDPGGFFMVGPVHAVAPAAAGLAHSKRTRFVECMEGRGYTSRVLNDGRGVHWFVSDATAPPLPSRWRVIARTAGGSREPVGDPQPSEAACRSLLEPVGKLYPG